MRVENLIQSKILCTKYLTVENNRLYGMQALVMQFGNDVGTNVHLSSLCVLILESSHLSGL